MHSLVCFPLCTESKAKETILELENKKFHIVNTGYFDPTASFSHASFSILEAKKVILGKTLLDI